MSTKQAVPTQTSRSATRPPSCDHLLLISPHPQRRNRIPMMATVTVLGLLAWTAIIATGVLIWRLAAG